MIHTPLVSLDIRTDDDDGGGMAAAVAAVWCTLDQGRTWSRTEVISEVGRPLVIRAPGEGVNGYYIIFHNDLDSANKSPQPGDAPHVWAFVDFTPPIVQVHSVQKDEDFRNTRRLRIRFSVYDAHLAARPITLDYRREGHDRYQPIVRDVSDSGAYDWQVPADLHGRIVVRVLARDRGGHIGSADSPLVDLDGGIVAETEAPHGSAAAAEAAGRYGRGSATSRPATGESERMRLVGAPQRPAHVGTGATLGAGAGGRGAEASEALKEAEAHCARGEWVLAEECLRQAIAVGDGSQATQNRLAAVLLRRGQMDESERLYRAALHRQENDAEALAGLALALAAQRDYRAARDVLRSLATVRPDDAEVWLNLGDMCALSGDRAAARAAWRRARESSGASAGLVERARRRLLIYPAAPVP